LGYHKSISPNIEAMVYAKSLDKDRWKTELELDKIIKSKNEINISDELIKFDKPTKNSHNYDFHISYVEYRNNHFIVQLGKNVAGSDYSLHLLDDSKEELLVINKCQLKNNSLVFELNTKVKEFPSLCFLHINKVGDSNIQVINNIGELSYNAPKPSLTYLYEIIQAQNSDKFADFGNLLDPIEKLIENDYNNYRIITLHNSSDDNDSQENKSSVDITYEEFIGKEKPIHISSKNKIYAESTDLGFLLKYLLSRIGLYKKTESVDADEELSISEGIYDEEKNEDDLRWKSDEYYYYSTKKHIKYSNQTEVRYYKNGIKRLASRFTNYLEFLHEGDSNKNLAPPSSIDSSFIYKYLSVLMLVNYFAGREYKIGKEVVETLSIYDDNYEYWMPTLDIIGLTFCYKDSKGDIETIFRRTNIGLADLASNDDLKAIILLTLFTLSSLKVLYAEEETRDIEVTFVRFAMAVDLKNLAIDHSELHEHFDKYFNDCGFSNKRHVLTQQKIITLDNVNKEFNKLSQLYRGISKTVKSYEERKLKFDELRTEKKSVNNFVWNPRVGLTFIEEFTSERVVNLYSFGHTESKRLAVDFLAPLRPN
jgi:hypothetical protein